MVPPSTRRSPIAKRRDLAIAGAIRVVAVGQHPGFAEGYRVKRSVRNRLAAIFEAIFCIKQFEKPLMPCFPKQPTGGSWQGLPQPGD
jgi:hypothetical protein